jgi:hypothetical protein
LSTVARLTFSGPLTEAGSVSDGNYTLTVLGGQLVGPGGQALDGDGDGRPGGNFASSFHRLFGDAIGDRDVDSEDLFFGFRPTFGRPAADVGFAAEFDADGDGDVDAADLFQFRRRFGTALP